MEPPERRAGQRNERWARRLRDYRHGFSDGVASIGPPLLRGLDIIAWSFGEFTLTETVLWESSAVYTDRYVIMFDRYSDRPTEVPA